MHYNNSMYINEAYSDDDNTKGKKKVTKQIVVPINSEKEKQRGQNELERMELQEDELNEEAVNQRED